MLLTANKKKKMRKQIRLTESTEWLENKIELIPMFPLI